MQDDEMATHMRLQQKYREEVIPAMMSKFGYKNPMAAPSLEKVVVNTGLGKMLLGVSGDEGQKIRDAIAQDIAAICGQKPVFTRAKKSISSFKLRKGQIVGARVTLRRKRMYDFLERLIYITLPRCRDFHGIPLSSVDKSGNLTIGIKDHSVFPEILPEKVRYAFGVEITIVTTANTREEGIELLRLLGFPLRQEGVGGKRERR